MTDDKFAAMAEKIYGDHRDGMEVINAITEALCAVEKEAREDESKKMQEISELRVQQAYERGQNSQTFELYELHRSDGTIEKWSEDFEARITREARTAALEEAAKEMFKLEDEMQQCSEVYEGHDHRWCDRCDAMKDAYSNGADRILKLKGDLK